MYTFQCYSLKSSHPLLLALSPKSCSLCLYLPCCPAHRIISTTSLDSIYIYICVNIRCLSFPFWLTALCVGEGNGTPVAFSTLAWKIPWMEEPGRLQTMVSLRVGHDWATSLSLFIFMHWRKKWQPTPVFLPGEFQGRGSLVGYCLWGRTELDSTEAT